MIALATAGCAPLPRYSSLPMSEIPSPNFNARRPNFVIIHHTSDNTAEESLRTLTSAAKEVSAHYLVTRDGKIIYLVDEMARAWHAGDSYWGGNTDLNSSSIGIELDNNGNEPFAEPMMQALLLLLADLKTRYRIPAANFLAHGDVAPGRKTDPSRFFNWKRLAEQGFGVWCEPPYAAAADIRDDALLLAAFGYDVTNFTAAVSAFKRRFLAEQTTAPLTERDRAMLRCLISRKAER